MSNHLYYGDNLATLRKHIRDESVDLVYLDPPFNSNAIYNVLFRCPSGDQSQAQIEAFEDTKDRAGARRGQQALVPHAEQRLLSGAHQGFEREALC